VLLLFKNWLSYNRCKLLSRDNTLFELSTKLLSNEITTALYRTFAATGSLRLPTVLPVLASWDPRGPWGSIT
jgi:hypothetical protein